MDIYRPNDFSYTQQPQYTQAPITHAQPMGMPAINFAPVIKVTGGNDFSTEPIAASIESPNEPIKNDFINRMGVDTKKEKEKEEESNDSGKIDFTKLVVRKV
jgi:hypothetical protein